MRATICIDSEKIQGDSGMKKDEHCVKNKEQRTNKTLIYPEVCKIHRPLLVSGITAARMGLTRFSTISGHAFSYRAICC